MPSREQVRLAVSPLAVLADLGLKYNSASQTHVSLVCPFHDDSSPSLHLAVNGVDKGLFHCKSCQTSGDLATLCAKILNRTRHEIIEVWCKQYKLNDEAGEIPAETISRYHATIFDHPHLVQALYDRALTDADIREHLIGHRQGRIVIPVRGDDGTFVNCRLYLPGALTGKYKSLKGRGKCRIYLPGELAAENVLICGGELKAITARAAIAKLGKSREWGVCAFTGGEKTTPSVELLERFRGKQVAICYDIDKAGVSGASELAIALLAVGVTSRIVSLPLDHDKYPHGDVNDYLIAHSPEAFFGCIESAVLFALPKRERDVSAPIRTTISQAITQDFVHKRVSLECQVIAVNESPHFVPRRLVVACSKDTDFCGICPVAGMPPGHEWDIDPESPSILDMMVANTDPQKDATALQAVGVPKRCRKCHPKVLSYYRCDDSQIGTLLDLHGHADNDAQSAVFVGDDASDQDINATITCEAKVVPHPKTQQATFLVSRATPTIDSLSHYSDPRLSDLRIFQARGDRVAEQVDRVLLDLTNNVTKIYCRPELHVATLLTYCSALNIPFDGKLHRGWVESLIVGDSSQGKTDAVIGLAKWLTIGEVVSCKNATVAGLLGGAAQINSRWYLRWGAIPTHDRRIVILEELKGAKPHVVAALTDMRSSGVAELPKIVRGRALARTRLIALSNPRSGLPMSAHAYGCQALLELCGAPEDLRRFDLSVCVREGDIPMMSIQSAARATDHIYDSDYFRRLILWAWTRKGEQIEYACGERYIADVAAKIAEKYDDTLPIWDRGSARLKLARIAVACAAMQFSTDSTYQTIRVTEHHVDYVATWLQQQYDGLACGYKSYSDAQRLLNTIDSPGEVLREIKSLPYAGDFCKLILSNQIVTDRDIMSWASLDIVAGNALFSLLVRKRCLIKPGVARNYSKSPGFIQLLQSGEVASFRNADLPPNGF